jgi:hypothetical protein
MKKQYAYVVIQKVFDEEYGMLYSSAETMLVFLGENAELRAESYCEEMNRGSYSEFSVQRTEIG